MNFYLQLVADLIMNVDTIKFSDPTFKYTRDSFVERLAQFPDSEKQELEDYFNKLYNDGWQPFETQPPFEYYIQKFIAIRLTDDEVELLRIKS
ncbi:MAG: hypothetical protein EOO16_00385 [Chitinophagaceae bacterium]|nr:MAG: hypothetical protein EOO16_00385 [Chitinophagaceae bacterium]